NLVYTPTANANGNSYATIGFKVQDAGGTANGGVDTSISANTLTVNVSAVNDIPVINAITTTARNEQTNTTALTASIPVTFTDVDLTDVGHTASITGVVASDTITGTNDAPLITSGSSGAVAENAATTTVIYTASATDADAGDTRTYSLKPATGDVSLLNINTTTGAVTLKASADYETRPSYSFTVVATDTANTSTEQAVTVAVTNVNEAPVFTTTNLSTTYTDTAATDTFSNSTGTFSAIDLDAGATLNYGVSGGSGTTTITKAGTYGTFSINSASGAYTYTPNHSAINALTTTQTDAFTISVSDGSFSATTNYTVTLIGSNEAPSNTFNTTVTLTPGTGGTITQVGNDYVHTFTSTGTSSFVAPNANLTAQILVVGGGGSGGPALGGGG
ncbi:MAG: hypothetical protein EBR64_08130, partial [Burkholderiaceae bacterium]|nr:hypothetical protein [Burkholderiaceae bacterium]